MQWSLPECDWKLEVVSDAGYDPKRKTKPRATRLQFTIPPLMKRLDALQKAYPEARWVLGMEHYAMGRSERISRMTQLAEASGALKYECAKRNWFFHELPPTTIKKAMSGYGFADKVMMYHAWERHLPASRLPSLTSLLGRSIRCNTPSRKQAPDNDSTHELKDAIEVGATALEDGTKKETGSHDTEEVIPKPIEDLVDAFAVCLALTTLDPFPKAPKKAHTKRLDYTAYPVVFGTPSDDDVKSWKTTLSSKKRKSATRATAGQKRKRSSSQAQASIPDIKQPLRKRAKVDPSIPTNDDSDLVLLQ